MKRIVVLLLLLVPLMGCGQPRSAAVKADGSRYAVYVIVDSGITATMTESQLRAQEQMASWMENDLLNLLKRAGYQAVSVANSAQFEGGSGNYLLQVKIVNYNPGSKAARMLVGFGAGATSLDIQYQIVNGQKLTLEDRSDGVGSSRDWSYCGRVLNQRMIATLGTTVGR